jgi:LPS-assembly protein
MMAGAPGARLPSRRCSARIAAAAFAFLATLVAIAAGGGPAAAQSEFLTFREQLRPKAPAKSAIGQKNANGQMLVQANEIRYDYTNELVSAVGNVQIYYNGATLEADKVVYDQRSKRLHAEGNARLTEADGKITYGEQLDLSDDFRNGFIDSLRLETLDDTRMAAVRADRTGANYTVFQSGVYTACEACKDDPLKPPLWQVKAVRIIHDEANKMMYFEDAKVEFFGVPLAYFPYFSAPDPSVKRKSGFLMPVITTSSAYGLGIETPYYLALAPNYDLTISPRITTTQGPLVRTEYRQRFEEGSLTFRASGIDQLDPNYFVRNDGSDTPGFREWRGALETQAKFALSPRWTWGFDGVLVSDQHRPAAECLDRRRVANLPHRPRRPQLFRHADHQVLRVFRIGRAEHAAGHPAGDRLRLYVRSAGVQRRARIQREFHQPVAPDRELRCDQPERREQQLVRHQRRPGPEGFLQLPAAWLSRYLHASVGGSHLAQPVY